MENATCEFVDEMAHAWMNVVYLTDDEYKALLAQRKEKATQVASAGQDLQ